MFERVLNNTNSYFDESYPSPLPPAPLNLQIWFKISAPLFNNTLPHPTIQLQGIKIFKTGFRKLLILSKLGITLITLAPLWRIAYENRYTTRSWVVHRFDGFGLLIKLLITTFDFGSFSSLSFFSNIKQANTFWAVSAVASYAPICTIISTRSWSNKSPRFYFKLFFLPSRIG